MHVNKVSRVRTIDGSKRTSTSCPTSPSKMEREDGLIWVLGLGDESVMTFTDDAVDSLVELIKPAGK